MSQVQKAVQELRHLSSALAIDHLSDKLFLFHYKFLDYLSGWAGD
jgi:hypothetical protein